MARSKPRHTEQHQDGRSIEIHTYTVFPQIIDGGDYFYFRTKRGRLFEGGDYIFQIFLTGDRVLYILFYNTKQ